MEKDQLNNLAPICLFVYNRPDITRKTLQALEKNFLAKKSKLFIFSDGPKNTADKKDVEEVRRFINGINDFFSVEIIESKDNIGLADSIISGVTKILNTYNKVIVLEDDLLTSPNFLDFMNQALEFYSKEPKVFSISGYTPRIDSFNESYYDNYFWRRASSWGWATWFDRWNNIDWEVSDFPYFKNNMYLRYKFNKGGSDMSRMLIRQQKGKIDSWAIRWTYHQFKEQTLTVFPKKTKILNIGIGENSTHTKRGSRFMSNLDKGFSRSFNFNKNININKKTDKEFRSYFSLKTRIINRLRGK